MTYYHIMANFKIDRYAITLEEAEKIFKNLVNDGMTYVELSFVEDYEFYKSHSLKIYYK